VEGSKSDDIQQDAVEMFLALKEGKIMLNCPQSPRSGSRETNKTKDVFSAPSKRWADIVKESDDVGSNVQLLALWTRDKLR
jgi:hypothetical protein